MNKNKIEDKANIVFEKAIGMTMQIFGFIFRLVFILSLGLVSYFLFKPEVDIGTTPLAQLTLSDIFRQIYSILTPLVCIYWLFNPNREEEKPYDTWATWGILLFVVIILFLAFF